MKIKHNIKTLTLNIIKMHKFLVRAASGLVYAAVIVLAIYFGGFAMLVLAALFAVIGIIELDRMQIGISEKTLPVFLLDIFGVLSFLGIATYQHRICLILWIGLFIIRFIAARRIENSTEQSIRIPSGGQVYLGIPFAFMIFLIGQPIQKLPLLVFVMLWLNDSGAYIVGSLMGKHKMSPKISPKKTWEGFFGGVVISLIGSVLLFKYLDGFFGMQAYGVWTWLTLAMSTCIFGTLGDLLESKIKRKYGFKDSGKWIPGHGGLLDRIDSFLTAYPIAFLLVYIMG